MSGHFVTTRVAAWVFGKLPSHGDFVSRGVPPAMRDALDQWLSAAMAEARGAHGAAFEARYDAAPPWQFVEAADAGGAGGWTGGTLVASVDSAGRRFPLIVARTADDVTGATGAALACEAAIYRAFFGVHDVDTLWADAGGAVADADEGEPGWWTDGSGDHDAARLPPGRPVELIATMLKERADA